MTWLSLDNTDICLQEQRDPRSREFVQSWHASGVHAGVVRLSEWCFLRPRFRHDPTLQAVAQNLIQILLAPMKSTLGIQHENLVRWHAHA